VAKYQLFQGVLTFWLDTRGYEESTTEYRLSFCTGDVTSPNGDGIIHNMYGMKQFFEQAGNTNLMASLLAEKGITSKMRFDQHDESGSGVWRIFDETSGVWKHHKGDHQPEDIISEYIKQELRPLKEMEFFFGRDLAWERRKAAVDEPLEGEAVEVCPEDSASQSGRSVGSKRSRNTMSSLSRMYKSRLTIESALYKYCKVPREQAEILKMLQHKVSLCFTEKQKPHVVCCRNGLLDLRTGELKGKLLPDDYITQMCLIDYNPDADTLPAVELFEKFFPLEAYPDQKDIIAFLQQYLGYCLTMETSLQLCLFGYGNGSNGKSLILELLDKVFGKELCCTIPVESLAKARGQNNDSLNAARHARLVTLSETNGPAKVNEAILRTLICGETITNKAMYQKEINFKLHMKLFFMVNDPPDWMGKSYCTGRRMAYLKFRTIFVNTGLPKDRNEAEALRNTGAPECLIQPKDQFYYRNNLAGKEPCFLKFFSDGAKQVYPNNMQITIPESMAKLKEAEEFNIPTAVEAFVTSQLYPASGGFVFVSDLYNEFKASNIAQFGEGIAVKFEAFDDKRFGSSLVSAIEKRKTMPGTLQFWADTHKEQVNCRKEKKKGMAWRNLGIKNATQQLPENRYAAPNSMV
jgi:P4 family phage/plasmid primase-like protien